MGTLDLSKHQAILKKFSEERNWDQFHSVKNLCMALSVETAELLEIVQWMSESESNNLKNDSSKKKMVEEEVADIFIYLLRIISKMDINLDQVITDKMKSNEKKYPVELAKGNSKKYNEF